MPSFSEAQQNSISATLNEIRDGEAAFKQQHDVDIAEPDEWMQLKDIVARIERKLLAGLSDKPAAAAAEEVA
jgi:hypothetical protein